MDERRTYLTIEELSALWRNMTAAEQERAAAYIPTVTSELRLRAKNMGKDLDELAEDPDYKAVLKSVIADVVGRVLMTSTSQEPMTQMTQSAGGYSVQGSFLIPGGGLFIKKSELARLGLKRQRMGAVEIYGT